MLLRQKLQDTELFSGNEQLVSQYLLEHLDEVDSLSITDVSKATFTSLSTSVRLANKLGFQGYKELRKALSDESKYLLSHFTDIDPNQPFNKKDNLDVIKEKIAVLLKDAIDDTSELLDHRNVSEAVRFLDSSRTIYVLGHGGIVEVAQDFRFKLREIGRGVMIIDNPDYFISTIDQAKEDDCFIIISYTGSTDKLLDSAKLIKKKKIPLIVLTSIGDNPISILADCIFRISTREKMCSKVGTFVTNESVYYILDVIYASLFAKHYDYNWNHRLEQHEITDSRSSASDILKEDKR